MTLSTQIINSTLTTANSGPTSTIITLSIIIALGVSRRRWWGYAGHYAPLKELAHEETEIKLMTGWHGQWRRKEQGWGLVCIITSIYLYAPAALRKIENTKKFDRSFWYLMSGKHTALIYRLLTHVAYLHFIRWRLLCLQTAPLTPAWWIDLIYKCNQTKKRRKNVIMPCFCTSLSPTSPPQPGE